MQRITARDLNRKWRVGVRHALYHMDGHFYERLTRFPAALFDPIGYVRFEREQDYLASPYLSVGVKTNVIGGKSIRDIPAYVRVVEPSSGESAA